MAGLTVGIVALPLALGFGVASGVGAAAGLITAIVAGLVAAVLGGSHLQVSGPTGAMTVVLVPVVARYGPEAVFALSILAGLLVVVMGLVGMGRLVSVIPWPVVEGFTLGIGVIIFLQQVPLALDTPKADGVNAGLVALAHARGRRPGPGRGAAGDDRGGHRPHARARQGPPLPAGLAHRGRAGHRGGRGGAAPAGSHRRAAGLAARAGLPVLGRRGARGDVPLGLGDRRPGGAGEPALGPGGRRDGRGGAQHPRRPRAGRPGAGQHGQRGLRRHARHRGHRADGGQRARRGPHPGGGRQPRRRARGGGPGGRPGGGAGAHLRARRGAHRHRAADDRPGHGPLDPALDAARTRSSTSSRWP